MDDVLVSIALCTYNGEKHLTTQIKSILNQTFKNLEIIIVDDGSTDSTFSIAEEFSKQDARIKCYRNETNLGFNRNFEKAIKLTTGQFIAISDQDDIWLPEKIERLMAAIGGNWLVFSNSVYINEVDQVQNKHLLSNFKFDNYNYESILLVNFVTGHTCLMARAFLDYILPFPKAGYYDWWMGFIALYHHKLEYADHILTHYRMHELSVTQTDLRKDKREFSRISFNVTIKMMSNFLSYKNLQKKDAAIIQKLIKVYSKKITRSYYIPLILFVNKYYEFIFPGMKKRTGLSRLNFAIKYSRRYK